MLKNLFVSRSQKKENKKVVIVSGLPRSGTSMMMKMLVEGGLPAVMDSLRQADEDNPNGYFEIEDVKALKDGQSRWIYDAPGKVVKVISYLLEFLPKDLDFDVIFMDREIHEVLASQKKMLARRNETSLISDEDMEKQYRDHLKAVKYWLPRQPNVRVMYVKYDQMVKSPQTLVPSILEFLNLPLNAEAMTAVPNPSLYRNRQS
ncbi:MAG: sulfotransferase [Chloroflexi bacterium]|nr:sulfotransferase [Chloroflexota bacterium]